MIKVDKKEDSKWKFQKKECKYLLFWRGLIDERKCNFHWLCEWTITSLVRAHNDVMSYSESRDYGHKNSFIRLPLIISMGKATYISR